MKVLYLANEYREELRPLAGIYVRDQALAVLAAGGVEVAVCYVEPRSLRTLGLSALREHHFQTVLEQDAGITVLRQRGWNPASATVRGGRLLGRWTASLAGGYVRRFGRPDLVHAHNAMWAGHAAELVARRYALPYIITEHSSLVLSGRVPPAALPDVRSALRGAARLFAVSAAIAAAVEQLGGVPAEVLPNPLDTDFFHPPPAEPPAHPLRFVAVGALYPVKGFDLLLDAFARAFGGRGAELEIVGGGPERAALEQRAAALGIAAQVRWTGEVGRDAVREAMWRAHALVVSSRHETFSIVTAEALATGLPVVATRCGGPEEIIPPGAGVLVERDSMEQLARGMEEVLRLPSGRESRRQPMVARFGRIAVGRRLRAVYEEVAGRARTTAAGQGREP